MMWIVLVDYIVVLVVREWFFIYMNNGVVELEDYVCIRWYVLLGRCIFYILLWWCFLFRRGYKLWDIRYWVVFGFLVVIIMEFFFFDRVYGIGIGFYLFCLIFWGVNFKVFYSY